LVIFQKLLQICATTITSKRWRGMSSKKSFHQKQNALGRRITTHSGVFCCWESALWMARSFSLLFLSLSRDCDSAEDDVPRNSPGKDILPRKSWLNQRGRYFDVRNRLPGYWKTRIICRIFCPDTEKN
jgi:hypothetical protein